MKEDYVSLEIAKLLKEKRFNEKCRSYYADDDYRTCASYVDLNDFRVDLKVDITLRPTHQMAMAWLREEKNIFITIYCGRNIHNDEPYYRATWQNLYDEPKEYPINTDNNYSVYEICVEDAIKYCLTNLI